MRAGRLRHKATIQTSTEAQNSFGEPIRTWTTFATVWMEIAPMTGRELTAQKAALSETTIRVVIRYLSGVTPKMRVVYGTRTLEIESVADRDERHAEMELMCHEVT